MEYFVLLKASRSHCSPLIWYKTWGLFCCLENKRHKKNTCGKFKTLTQASSQETSHLWYINRDLLYIYGTILITIGLRYSFVCTGRSSYICMHEFFRRRLIKAENTSAMRIPTPDGIPNITLSRSTRREVLYAHTADSSKIFLLGISQINR